MIGKENLPSFERRGAEKAGNERKVEMSESIAREYSTYAA